MRGNTGITCGTLALLLLGLSPAIATAQSEVQGHGIFIHDVGLPNGGQFFNQISVNAWLDDQGVAHGTMIWVGGVFQPLPGNGQQGGPADPWFIAVTDIFFDGNTAYVFGVVVHSIFPGDEGTGVGFSFTDNSGTGLPDLINGTPIDGGNIIVR